MSEERATEKRPTDRLVGELLASRYLIEHKLGEGAMGAVYRARHVKVGRPFAVKVLHRKLLEDSKIALRFEREAELAGRLHHPNVVGVVDVGETADGLRYMVMDFAEGQDLAELLTEAPMPPERIISLVRQMLEGLYHAHEAGLIHRDFKPENVIVERNDHGTEVPRIVDFGISILREGGDSNDGTGRLTTNGLVLGTPHYMAPEQAVADPIDHRIDLFAMGIVVYEMLSGKLPFDGSGAEVARANLLLDPPPISQRVPFLEVDPLLEAFSRRLMAKRRDHRPSTAKQAREILDLIERDRAAAAAALGVPLDFEVRTPKTTQPVAPHGPAGPEQHGTERAKRIASAEHGPPQAAQAAQASPPAPPLEAPPVQHAQAVPMPPMASSPAVATPTDELPPTRATAPRTTMTDPLPWGGESPRSRRRWMIAGGVGLAAAGAIVAIAIGASGGDPATRPEGQKISMTATPEPAPTPEPASTPEPAPAPPTPATPDPAASATPPPAPAASDPLPGPGSAVENRPSVAPDPVPTRPNPAVVKPAPDPTKGRPGKKPDPSAVKARPDPTKPGPTKPDPTKPDPTKPGTARPVDVGQKWQQVGAAINALKQSPATRAEGERLFGRWNRIHPHTAQLSEQARKQALAELDELQRLADQARSKAP